MCIFVISYTIYIESYNRCPSEQPQEITERVGTAPEPFTLWCLTHTDKEIMRRGYPGRSANCAIYHYNVDIICI